MHLFHSAWVPVPCCEDKREHYLCTKSFEYLSEGHEVPSDILESVSVSSGSLAFARLGGLFTTSLMQAPGLAANLCVKAASLLSG